MIGRPIEFDDISVDALRRLRAKLAQPSTLAARSRRYTLVSQPPALAPGAGAALGSGNRSTAEPPAYDPANRSRLMGLRTFWQRGKAGLRQPHHPGVDLRGIARALLANIRAGEAVQGGSTLTQQLAKNAFLSSERSLLRKINEAFLALLLEYRLDKETILTAYMNNSD